MTRHLPVFRLYVHRRFANGETVLVGQIAQNPRGVYFQYDPGYLEHHNLSPFKLGFDGSLTKGPPTPHRGLHGVFADTLPDGWGLSLMDRVFRRHGIQPHQITALDRLAYVGDHGMGALTYSPVSEFLQPEGDQLIDIARLGPRPRRSTKGRQMKCRRNRLSAAHRPAPDQRRWFTSIPKIELASPQCNALGGSRGW